MGKHFSPKELDSIHAWKADKISAADIHRRLQAARRKRGESGPHATSVERAFKGATFRRARAEARGRKAVLTPHNLRALDAARKRLISKASGDYEVHWDDVIRAARVPPVHRTTAARALKTVGYDIEWRAPRLKPDRSDMDESQRKELCDKLRKLPPQFWTEKVDAYVDCKRWPIPRNVRGHKFLNKLKVRGHLRTKSEGLKKHFTKPDKRKHHRNTGANVNVFAAIIGEKVRVWHYMAGTWSGAAAVQVYKDVLSPALRRYRGVKREYTILEDNDPTGFKAKVAIAAKAELKIKPLAFPTYSPDINPCDYALWDEVARRMAEQATPKNESMQAFKLRLQKAAKTVPPAVVRKMLRGMKDRVQAIYDADGGHIARD